MPAVQARFVTFHADGLSEAHLLMEGLRCAACAWLVEQVVRRVPGVGGAEVNYATRRAFVRWDASRARLSQILEAVREAKGEQAAQLIEDLKKAEMAREAERLLEGTGWVPEPLRLRGADASESPDAGDLETLPAFLADDSDGEPRAVAAE